MPEINSPWASELSPGLERRCTGVCPPEPGDGGSGAAPIYGAPTVCQAESQGSGRQACTLGPSDGIGVWPALGFPEGASVLITEICGGRRWDGLAAASRTEGILSPWGQAPRMELAGLGWPEQPGGLLASQGLGTPSPGPASSSQASPAPGRLVSQGRHHT